MATCFDFYKQLKADPARLHVLGNGKQRKSYLYVQDCLDAIQVAVAKATERVNIFNLGVEGYCEVDDSTAGFAKAWAFSRSWSMQAETEVGSATVRLSFSIQRRSTLSDGPPNIPSKREW